MGSVYKRLDENGRIIPCPKNDFDGKHTGKVILNLPAYFDEHPDERIAGGWVLFTYGEKPAYNHCTEYLQLIKRTIDAHTVHCTWRVMQKTEEMLLLDEMNMDAFLLTNEVEYDINALYQLEGNV